MNKESMTNFFNEVRTAANKHSPEILTGMGVSGMIATTVLAVRATPKALLLIEKAENHRKLTKIETLKIAWKPYIPAIITGTISTTCLIGASRVSFKRNAALATAYTLSEKALKEYKDSVIETIGEKKEKAVREKVAQKKIDENLVSNSQVILTKKGETLCYDGVSGRYFKSDVSTIEQAINEINRTMTYDMYASLSDFYDAIGLEHTGVSDQLGWNLDDGLMAIDFSSKIADDGTPCIVLDYRVAPRYDFTKLM